LTAKFEGVPLIRELKLEWGGFRVRDDIGNLGNGASLGDN